MKISPFQTHLSLALMALSLLWVPTAQADPRGKAMRPVHTYSIVARDAKTGELGAAVQSHWFSVGSGVIWAEPGIGAVATQSFTDPSYGPLGLRLMRDGKDAPHALKALLAGDDHIDVRQVGMVDAAGNVANHTGSNAIIAHCNRTGDGYAIQANLMDRGTVCDAMVKAFEGATGDLAERMMLALEAAQAEGGDIRGQQSSAMVVVSGDNSIPAWGGRKFDLRVEDHATPVKELRRLLKVARVYALMSEGDDHMTEGNVDKALESYGAAEAMDPSNHEAVFWHAVTLASIDRVEESLPLFALSFKLWPKWRELVTRLPEAKLLPDDPAVMKQILNAK